MIYMVRKILPQNAQTNYNAMAHASTFVFVLSGVALIIKCTVDDYEASLSTFNPSPSMAIVSSDKSSANSVKYHQERA